VSPQAERQSGGDSLWPGFLLGQKTAVAEYGRQIAQWLARYRLTLIEADNDEGACVAVVELIAAY